MKRLQLFELEDYPWFPDIFRKYLTDGMCFMMSKMQLYDPIIPKAVKVMKRMETSHIVDLCSGGAGPWLNLVDEFAREIPDIAITLTDKYPSSTAQKRVESYSKRIKYLTESIDALDVPKNMTGMRTMFTSFHHFPPQAAQRILQSAVRDRAAIGVFEYTERRLSRVIIDAIKGPFFVWLTGVFIKPFSLSRLFWTYVVPVIPIVGPFDGVVSDLRTYSVDELEKMVAGIEGSDYTWDIGQILSPIKNLRITYLLGYPE